MCHSPIRLSHAVDGYHFARHSPKSVRPTRRAIAFALEPGRYSAHRARIDEGRCGRDTRMSLGSKGRSRSLRGLTVLGISAGMVVAGMASAQAAPASGSAPKPATGNVIVLLRNQHSNVAIGKGRTSPRVAVNRSDQAPVLAEAKARGARNLHSFGVINGFSATVTAAQASALAADPAVAQVFPDLAVQAAPVPATATATTTTPPRPPRHLPRASARPIRAGRSSSRRLSASPTPLSATRARRRRRTSSTARGSRSPSSPTAWTSTTPTSSARTARTSSWTTRTSPATGRPPRRAARRRSAMPARSPPRVARSMTSRTT